jgi:hypothetical protein
MGPALCLAAALPVSELPPKARLEAYLTRSPHLQLEIELTVAPPGGAVTRRQNASFKVGPGNHQSFRVEIPGGWVEWRQAGEQGMELSSVDQAYKDWDHFTSLSSPPPKSNGLLTQLYPYYLGAGRAGITRSDQWKEVGDTITASGNDPMSGSFVITLELDKEGRPLKLVDARDGIEKVETVMTFKNARQEPAEPSWFSMEPPRGWMPYAVVLPPVVTPGIKVRNIDWSDGGRTRKFADIAGPEGSTLIFVDRDCGVCQAMGSGLEALVGELSKAGLKPVIVSIGEQPWGSVKGATTVHDSQDKIERELRIPSTPYFMTFSRDLTLARAYGSWSAGEAGKIVETLSKWKEEAE